MNKQQQNRSSDDSDSSKDKKIKKKNVSDSSDSDPAIKQQANPAVVKTKKMDDSSSDSDNDKKYVQNAIRKEDYLKKDIQPVVKNQIEEEKKPTEPPKKPLKNVQDSDSSSDSEERRKRLKRKPTKRSSESSSEDDDKNKKPIAPTNNAPKVVNPLEKVQSQKVNNNDSGQVNLQNNAPNQKVSSQKVNNDAGQANPSNVIANANKDNKPQFPTKKMGGSSESSSSDSDRGKKKPQPKKQPKSSSESEDEKRPEPPKKENPKPLPAQEKKVSNQQPEQIKNPKPVRHDVSDSDSDDDQKPAPTQTNYPAQPKPNEPLKNSKPNENSPPIKKVNSSNDSDISSKKDNSKGPLQRSNDSDDKKNIPSGSKKPMKKDFSDEEPGKKDESTYLLWGGSHKPKENQNKSKMQEKKPATQTAPEKRPPALVEQKPAAPMQTVFEKKEPNKDHGDSSSEENVGRTMEILRPAPRENQAAPKAVEKTDNKLISSQEKKAEENKEKINQKLLEKKKSEDVVVLSKKKKNNDDSESEEDELPIEKKQEQKSKNEDAGAKKPKVVEKIQKKKQDSSDSEEDGKRHKVVEKKKSNKKQDSSDSEEDGKKHKVVEKKKSNKKQESSESENEEKEATLRRKNPNKNEKKVSKKQEKDEIENMGLKSKPKTNKNDENFNENDDDIARQRYLAREESKLRYESAIPREEKVSQRELPDYRLCFDAKFEKLPKKIKKILAEKSIKSGSWTLFENLNISLSKIYEVFEEPMSKLKGFNEFLEEDGNRKLTKSFHNQIKNYSSYREVKKDGNSFYRAAGFLMLENLFLEFGSFANVENKDIFKLIERLDINNKNYLEFVKCKGYNLDSNLLKLLESSEFLMDILRRFLCYFVHKNFEFKEERKSTNKFWHKKKVVNLIAKSLREFPVLDVALIVYIRTLLNSDLTEMERKTLRLNIFGKEPSLGFLDSFSEKLGVCLNLFNFDLKEPEIHQTNNDAVHDINLAVKDGNYYVVYHEDLVKDVYEKQKK